MCKFVQIYFNGKIKKIIRDNGGIITEEHVEAIKSELSDILWYISSMCDTLGLKMEDIIKEVHPQNLWVPFGSGRSPSV